MSAGQYRIAEMDAGRSNSISFRLEDRVPTEIVSRNPQTQIAFPGEPRPEEGFRVLRASEDTAAAATFETDSGREPASVFRRPLFAPKTRTRGVDSLFRGCEGVAECTVYHAAFTRTHPQ